MRKEERNMTERNIDAALRAMAQNVPKAPESSVERMLKMVRKLGAEREARQGTVNADRPRAESRRDIAPPSGKMTL